MDGSKNRFCCYLCGLSDCENECDCGDEDCNGKCTEHETCCMGEGENCVNGDGWDDDDIIGTCAKCMRGEKMDDFERQCGFKSTAFIEKRLNGKNKYIWQKSSNHRPRTSSVSVDSPGERRVQLVRDACRLTFLGCSITTANGNVIVIDQKISNQWKNVKNTLWDNGLRGAINGQNLKIVKLLIKYGANDLDSAMNTCVSEYMRIFLFDGRVLNRFFASLFYLLYRLKIEKNIHLVWDYPEQFMKGVMDRRLRINDSISIPLFDFSNTDCLFPQLTNQWKRTYIKRYQTKCKQVKYLLHFFFPYHMINNIIRPFISH